MRRVVGVVSIVLAFIILSIGISTYINPAVFEEGIPFTGKASNSFVFLCINEPPVLNVSSCDLTINQSTLVTDNTAYCTINATDEGTDTLTYSTTANETWFSLNESTGAIQLRPFQSGVGSFDFTLFATDESGCVNNAGNSSFSVTVLDINDPPEYYDTIPTVSFSQGSSTIPFSLYTYFRDNDTDALNFTAIGNTDVTIAIDQVSGQTQFSASSCGSRTVIFRATDPSNATADSGVVDISIACPSTASAASSSSGGGSGGGGSSSSCRSNWNCGEWTECYVNGTRTKTCVDLNGCQAKDYQRIFEEECTYIPTCFDGIQNQDETGIDCGGSCGNCGTCYDGIMNNDEEGIDCGGSSCNACSSCNDGIQNYGETGVDCGGPSCPSCASCFDGIQNQDETGIDCGGSCPSCSIREIPSIIPAGSPITLLAMIIGGLIVTFMILFRFYHREIMSAITRLSLFLMHRYHKQELLSHQQKIQFLEKINEIHVDIREMNKPASTLLEKTAELYRSLMSSIFTLPTSFTPKELHEHIHTGIKHEPLRKILLSLFDAIRNDQQSLQHWKYEDGERLLEEVRLVIFEMSNVSGEDLIHEASEKQLDGTQIESFYALSYNTILALQYDEVDIAKKHYLKLVETYERLGEGRKSALYHQVHRLYQHIKYINSWTYK